MTTKEQYDELVEVMKAQADTLARIAESPLSVGTVSQIKEDDVLVSVAGSQFVIKQLKPTKKEPRVLEVGDSILIEMQTKQFVRYNTTQPTPLLATVSEIVEDYAAVDTADEKKLIPKIEGLRAGDQVFIDPSYSVITRILPRHLQAYSAPSTGVCWDDIGGNEDAKAALREAIELPHTHGHVFAHYGEKGSKGILLYGPPGCGKTLLGKAASTAIGASDGFIFCKGPEVLHELVGRAESNVRSLFTRARAYQAETGRRAVIFIDECEAVLGARDHRHSFMEKTVVPAFLAEMDGVEDSGAIVILATNRNMALDPAVVRDGRVDRKIKVARPGPEDAHAIVMTHLNKLPAQDPKEQIADAIVRNVWASESRFRQQGADLDMSDFVSGAMLAGIINKAKTAAIRRDIASGELSGVRLGDVLDGFRVTLRELSATALAKEDA